MPTKLARALHAGLAASTPSGTPSAGGWVWAWAGRKGVRTEGGPVRLVRLAHSTSGACSTLLWSTESLPVMTLLHDGVADGHGVGGVGDARCCRAGWGSARPPSGICRAIARLRGRLTRAVQRRATDCPLGWGPQAVTTPTSPDRRERSSCCGILNRPDSVGRGDLLEPPAQLGARVARRPRYAAEWAPPNTQRPPGQRAPAGAHRRAAAVANGGGPGQKERELARQQGARVPGLLELPGS